MISDDVAAYLIAQGVGTSANIFAGQIPEAIDSGIGVFEYQGQAPDKIVNLEFPNFEVQCRALDKFTAYNLAYDAYLVLNRQTDIVMNGVNYKRLEALSTPLFYGKDEKQRYQYLTNYTTIMVGGTFVAIAAPLCGDVTSICGNIIVGG